MLDKYRKLGNDKVDGTYFIKSYSPIKRGKVMSKIGEKIGELTILEFLPPHITPNGSKQKIVRVQCKCGKVYEVRYDAAKKTQRCRGCSGMSRRVDITGKKYGKLTVLSMAEDYVSPNGVRLARCNCICDCGKKTVVTMSQLVKGGTKSCGCIANSRGLLQDYPEYMAKYDHEKNADINLNILTTASHKKVWWKCSTCGQSWKADISSQTDLKKEHGCPYCSGRLVLKGKTDLASQRPELMTEWDYEKNQLKPDEVSYNSSQKAWWKCKECGHSWFAVISNRANGSGCPKCNIENVNSFCEQAVYYYVRRAFPDAVNTDYHTGMELDIYIPSHKVAIEYDGEAWHNTEKKIRTDTEKNRYCKAHGIEMIRIREPKCLPIKECTIFNRSSSVGNHTLDTVISEVLHYLSASITIDIDTKRDTPAILEMLTVKKKNNSLEAAYPEIAKEWHPTKNGKLTPDKIAPRTNRSVWWLGKCGHEWQMVISERTGTPRLRKDGKMHNPQGCPYCSSKRILIGFNDLQTKYPKIASEVHPSKNGELKATAIFPSSNKKIWWLGECGHEWQMSPNARCQQNQGCPICRKLKENRPVICIETGQIFNSGKEAAEYVNIKSPYTIYNCCKGIQKTSGGYHWKYSPRTQI